MVPTFSARPAFFRRRYTFFGVLLAALLVAVIADTAEAQPSICALLVPGHPADYYRARGCGLLESVEHIHLVPGQGHLRARQFQLAAAEFHFVLTQFPNHPQALLSMAQTCEQWKAPQCRTEEYFDNAISINPKVSGTYLTQGIYLHRARQYPKAIESFLQALKIEPNSVTAHYDLGLSYVETKQYELANQQAQLAYANGASLPGLRDRLQRAGHWNALEQKPPAEAGTTSPPAASQGPDNPVDGAPRK